MKISRRTLLTAASTMIATGLLPTKSVWANSNLKIGSKTIDVLSDGHLSLPASMLFSDISEKDLLPILEKYDLPIDQLQPDCNLTVIRDEDRIILFDVGAGPNFMPSAGKLTEAMDAMGLDPADVTHVVFTHAHPDHLWGLLDEFDDPLFPNAQHMIGKQEWDYWINPKTIDTIGEERQAFAVGANRLLMTMENNISFFKFGEEILPGIMARNSIGHTPGHTAFEVKGGSESLMIVGDAIGNHHVAFEKPAWLAGSDQDKDLGVKSRVSLLDQIASEKMMMIGYHLPNPGIGRAEKIGDGYRFIAA